MTKKKKLDSGAQPGFF